LLAAARPLHAFGRVDLAFALGPLAVRAGLGHPGDEGDQPRGECFAQGGDPRRRWRAGGEAVGLEVGLAFLDDSHDDTPLITCRMPGETPRAPAGSRSAAIGGSSGHLRPRRALWSRDLAHDREACGVEVHVVPPQPDALALAQSERQCHREQGPEVVPPRPARGAHAPRRVRVGRPRRAGGLAKPSGVPSSKPKVATGRGRAPTGNPHDHGAKLIRSGPSPACARSLTYTPASSDCATSGQTCWSPSEPPCLLRAPPRSDRARAPRLHQDRSGLLPVADVCSNSVSRVGWRRDLHANTAIDFDARPTPARGFRSGCPLC
jgi:hypothetical protein